MEWLGFLIGGLGVLLSAGTLVFAFLSWRNSRESAQIARDQASLQPELEASAEIERYPCISDEVVLAVFVSNVGKTSATQVHGWVRFDSDTFGPPKLRPMPALPGNAGTLFSNTAKPDEDGCYEAQLYKHEEMMISTKTRFPITVSLQRTGTATINCHVVCSEGVEFNKDLEIEIPEEPNASPEDFL